MASFKVEPSGNFVLLDISPKVVFGGDTQKVNADGIPLWTLKTLVDSENGPTAFVNVTVPSKVRPPFNKTEQVNFDNLVISYSKISGDTVVWLHADAVIGGGLNE